MIRTQIQLPEHEYESLRATAHRLHCSMAECVREAVSSYLVRVESPAAALELAGKFRPLPMEEVKEHDQQWAKAILPDESP